MTGAKSTRYLVINPNGTMTTYNQPLSVGDAQDIVGGDFETLPEPRDVRVLIMASTEGKRLGMDANWYATKLIKHNLRSTDFVAGNVIVAGLPDGQGELTDLSEADEQVIRDVATAS